MLDTSCMAMEEYINEQFGFDCFHGGQIVDVCVFLLVYNLSLTEIVWRQWNEYRQVAKL